jgi:RimJ/RimL family protein N-acetyltransferase
LKSLIKNNDIIIAYSDKEDIKFVMEAENNCENSPYVGQWSFDEHNNAINNDDILRLIIKCKDGNSVGYIIIRGLKNTDNSLELMRIVITSKGFGHGKKAISLLQKWCFEEQQAHRLWLDVREDNDRAKHVYESLGFKREGLLRECIRIDNSYKSLIVMSILSHEYKGNS